MLTVYGDLMPLRVLEEIRYWKMQEKEHTQFIRALVPSIEPEYGQLLADWERVFTASEEAAQNQIRTILENEKHADARHSQALDELLNQSLDQSNQWIEHQRRLLEGSDSMRSNPSVQNSISKIVSQSKYFMGVFSALLEDQPFQQQTSHRTYQVIGSGHFRSELGGTIAENPVPIGGHKLPPLPYAYDALEPYIDEQTMRLHHDKHHQSYVDGLNKAEKMLQTARETNDFELIKHWEREVAFNGAGHYLHTIFWNVMKPGGGGKPDGPIATQISQDFGSFERFKAQFTHAADKVEGGGWAILVWSPRSHRLEILQAEKHQNLTQWDVIPLLVLDVWEHAYYLKYQNERIKYIEAWWNTVNWDHVNERFSQARKLKWLPY